MYLTKKIMQRDFLGGIDMAKINYVDAKPANRLLVELDTGMVLYVNMTEKIKTCRFLDLQQEEVFKKVFTDGSAVYWADGFISLTLNEIYEMNRVARSQAEQARSNVI